MKSSLKGKNAIIGGSSRGIGKACAQLLSSYGANITLIARSSDLLVDVLKSLDRSQGQEHNYIVLDYDDLDKVRKTIKSVALQQTTHILVNNTGGPPAGPILDADPALFLKTFSRHVVVNQILAQALVPGMKAAAYGRIINIISTSVKEPIANLGVSNTIRAAVGNWAKSLSNELGAFGITVNNVLPGYTNTERLQSIIKYKSEQGGSSIEDVTSQMQNNVPMKRFATAEEIAAAVCFLASPDASYINGINVPVDGGRTRSL